MRAARRAIAATVGGAACTVGDHLHVAYGVLYYPHPVFWEQASWVFPLFFGATLAMIAGASLVCPSHPQRVPEGGTKRRIRAMSADFSAFLAAYVFTALAHPFPNVVLLVLLGAWLLRVSRGMPARLVAFCALSALIGSAFEASLSGLGGFAYRHPDFLGVPRWLPALYLHAALAGASTARIVDEIRPVRA